MQPHDTLISLTDAYRSIRLRLWTEQGTVNDLLLVKQVSGMEAVCGSVEYTLLCVATGTGLQLKQFMAMPAELQFATSTHGLRTVCGIVDIAEAGEADAGLATYQLTVRDALSLMDKGCNTRIFRHMNEVDITERILAGWCRDNPVLARAFNFELWRLASSYPPREFTMQYKESDSAFLRRLWKRRGLAWFFQPTANRTDSDAPSHTLILFDKVSSLAQNAAGTVRFHRDDGTERADSITAWHPVRRLSPGSVTRQSWDYKSARLNQVNIISVSAQGMLGKQFAAGLDDRLIDVQHAGDDAADYRALGTLRMLHHEFAAKCCHGEGGGRQWAPGQWIEVAGHAALDRHPVSERQFVFTELRIAAENNLPKTLNERVNRLFQLNRWSTVDTSGGGTAALAQACAERDGRYTVQFTCVRRDVPIVPLYDPRTDLPRTQEETAVVVGPEGESVYCDELGRVRVRFPGCRAEDGDGANAASAPITVQDSGWVLVSSSWAGAGFGIIALPRVGTFVIVSFLGGDPDKPIIVSAAHSGITPPPRFSHVSSLPGDRYLSGIVSREIGGTRSNQLRIDDTAGQISVQLASDHAASQLNLGCLTHPRSNGTATPRGDGFELASDGNGSIRAAKALLISTWGRLNACANQLSAEEHVGLLRDCADLFQSLGEVALANQALATDAAPQSELRDDLAAAGPDGQGGKPTLSVTAPAGIAFSTPKTIVSYAGVNLDTVAQQHMQLTSGQRFSLNAGKGISLFSHHDGIRQIAYHGKFVMQSQHDDMQIDAAQNLKVTVGRSLTIMAHDEITLMVGGGAYIRLKGASPEIGGPGPLTVKTDGHHWDGPASSSAELPVFGAGELGRVPRLLRPTDGQPVEGMQLKVQRDGDGAVAGRSDGAGEGARIVVDRLQKLKAFFFGPRS